jgi:hypothetical protein
VLNPGLNEERSNTVDNDNGVVVLGSDSLNELVSLEPSSQVPAVTHVAIECDVFFTRVGGDEDEGSVLVLGEIASALEVKVVEQVRERGMVLTSADSDGFKGL